MILYKLENNHILCTSLQTFTNNQNHNHGEEESSVKLCLYLEMFYPEGLLSHIYFSLSLWESCKFSSTA